MRTVVSGAAGFIGSHFCERLLAENHTVVGIDNFVTGARRNIAHLESHPRFEFIRKDITAPFSIEGPVDCVANLASPASPRDYLKRCQKFPALLLVANSRIASEKIFLSPASASSNARTLDSRPTTKGVIIYGKMTTSRIGIMGSFLVSNFSRWVTE